MTKKNSRGEVVAPQLTLFQNVCLGIIGEKEGAME